MQLLPAVVTTPRLTLRLWEDDDVPALSAAIAESIEHLRPWMPWAANEPVAPEARLALVRAWRATWEEGGDLVVGFWHDGRIVGAGGLHDRRGPGVLEIGYWLHVAHTGRGYATEAAAGLTGAAFSKPDIERVEIHHDRANTASGAVPGRLGFEPTGDVAADVTTPGESGVDRRWVMTRQRWEARTA